MCIYFVRHPSSKKRSSSTSSSKPGWAAAAKENKKTKVASEEATGNSKDEAKLLQMQQNQLVTLLDTELAFEQGIEQLCLAFLCKSAAFVKLEASKQYRFYAMLIRFEASKNLDAILFNCNTFS